VLTDWRSKGILPALKRIGQGKGQGTVSVWTTDILDHAAAAHYLMAYYGRSDFVITGLWLSGFHVDPQRLKIAWINQTGYASARMLRQASSFRSGFFGLARNWGTRLQESDSIPEFLGEFFEWRYDDWGRDSEALRLRFVELFHQLSPSSGTSIIADRSSYDFAEEVWMAVQPEDLFVPENVARFIETMTPEEVSALTPVFNEIRQMLCKSIDYPHPENHLFNLRFLCRLMSDLLGPVALAVTKLQRFQPGLPLTESIALLDEFATEVQWAHKIHNKNNDIFRTLEDRKQWVKTRRKLRKIWSTVI
jgi:hypothetical protein